MALEATEPVVEETIPQNTEQTPAVESVPADAVADVQPGDEGGADEQPGIDEELAGLARTYNLDPNDFGNDPNRVRSMVAKYDRQLAEFGSRLMQPGEPQAKAGDPPAKQAAAPSQFDFDKVFPGELSGDFDDQLKGWTKANREAAKAMHAHLEQQLAAKLEEIRTADTERSKRIETIEREIQQRKDEILEQQVDGFFAGLGKEWDGEFGKGSVRQVMAQMPMLAHQRQQVYADAMAMSKGMEQMGMQVPPLNDLLKRALHARYADKHTTFTRQALIQEAAKQKTVATSTGRKRTAPPTGRELAVQAYREGLKQLQASGQMPTE